MKLFLLGVELFFCALDQLFDKRPRPAGPELGCDDDGAWDDGTEAGEPWPVFISPARQIAELDYASLENAARGRLR